MTDPASLLALPAVDRILYCVGFDRSAGHSIREVYVDGLRRFLDLIADRQTGLPAGLCQLDRRLRRRPTGTGSTRARRSIRKPSRAGLAGMRSSSLPIMPIGTGTARSSCGMPACMGRGGSCGKRVSQRGEPVVGSPDKWLNFIQIDDAAAVTVRALDDVGSLGNELFLVADGHPLTRTEFYGAAAELLGAPLPRFETPAPGSPAAAREDSNKRINNRKLVERWGDCLRYTDIRAGLNASLAAS